MEQEIVNIVSMCKGSVLATKAPPVKYKPWPKMDQPWSRIHVDFAGSLEGFYYLLIVDSYSKWPEVFQCKKTHYRGNNKLPSWIVHTILDWVDCLVSDNRTQFTSANFKEFCETFQIKHITTPLVPSEVKQSSRTGLLTP